MKKYVLTSIAIAFFLLVFSENLLYAQNTNSENSPTHIDSSQSNADIQRITVLETRLNSAENYNGKILDTVYWSLGGLAGVILFVLGLNYFNNRNYVEGLKKDIKTSLQLEIRTLVDVTIESKLESKLNELKKELEQIHHIKYDLKKVAADKWLSEGVQGNVLSRSIEMLEMAKEMDYSLYISQSLEYIRKAIKNGGLLHYTTSTQILKLIDSLPSEYIAETEKIRELVKASVE